MSKTLSFKWNDNHYMISCFFFILLLNVVYSPKEQYNSINTNGLKKTDSFGTLEAFPTNIRSLLFYFQFKKKLIHFKHEILTVFRYIWGADQILQFNINRKHKSKCMLHYSVRNVSMFLKLSFSFLHKLLLFWMLWRLKRDKYRAPYFLKNKSPIRKICTKKNVFIFQMYVYYPSFSESSPQINKKKIRDIPLTGALEGVQRFCDVTDRSRILQLHCDCKKYVIRFVHDKMRPDKKFNLKTIYNRKIVMFCLFMRVYLYK